MDNVPTIKEIWSYIMANILQIVGIILKSIFLFYLILQMESEKKYNN